MLSEFDLTTANGRAGFERVLERLGATVSMTGDAADAVAAIVADVRDDGDDAVVRHMQRWTDPDFAAERIAVTPDELAHAEAALDPCLRDAIETAIANVRAYQEHIKPADARPIDLAGAELGLRFTPVDSAGLCVPGGTAVLFSTLVMLAVPALVAGVPAEQISVIHPPPTRREGEPARDISPIVLATARMLGLSRVYRIGGAQAVAALAYGTERVEPVSFIAGPGNVFVQLAKALVAGRVGTEGGFYGPSEIVTIADASASPERVAADLIAQAEHDPGKCFLVTWERRVLEAILGQVDIQLPQRQRREAIEQALTEESAAVLVADDAQAVDVANRIACEHVSLAVQDPDKLLAQLRHAGEVFLGDATPVAAGDYYAGPSHCLPTGRTARFASGVSAYTFLKRTGTVAYRDAMPATAIDHVARMAEAEGLDAHALSARLRGEGG